MKTFIFWVFLIALFVIHSLDMELTTYYIGNQWNNETFPLMRLCIREFGIYNSVWLSRIATYIFFFICFKYKHYDNILFLMFLITILYYVSMVPWLFLLKLATWPLPPTLY